MEGPELDQAIIDSLQTVAPAGLSVLAIANTISPGKPMAFTVMHEPLRRLQAAGVVAKELAPNGQTGFVWSIATSGNK